MSVLAQLKKMIGRNAPEQASGCPACVCPKCSKKRAKKKGKKRQLSDAEFEAQEDRLAAKGRAAHRKRVAGEKGALTAKEKSAIAKVKRFAKKFYEAGGVRGGGDYAHQWDEAQQDAEAVSVRAGKLAEDASEVIAQRYP